MQVIAVQLDVTSEGSVRAATQTVAKHGIGHLDVIINNAG
jgi:NAD(P)-dependent dehydrogenase (short-subunit alcohol dehydrogenase family)